MSDHSRDKSYAGYLGGIKKKILPIRWGGPSDFPHKILLIEAKYH